MIRNLKKEGYTENFRAEELGFVLNRMLLIFPDSLTKYCSSMKRLNLAI